MNRLINKIGLLLFLLLPSAALTGCAAKSTITYDDPYDAEAAIAYSYQYVEERNPEYADFDSNCTNYISQILIAGGKQMDEAIAPVKDKRIVYHNTPDQWFSTYIETDPARWKEFSVSNSFCRTTSFIKYWTEVRGMELTTYGNNMDGLLQLYDHAKAGDIILLYDTDGEISHLCFLAVKENMQLLLNANTIDYKEKNILDLSSNVYPTIGLLCME